MIKKQITRNELARFIWEAFYEQDGGGDPHVERPRPGDNVEMVSIHGEFDLNAIADAVIARIIAV